MQNSVQDLTSADHGLKAGLFRLKKLALMDREFRKISLHLICCYTFKTRLHTGLVKLQLELANCFLTTLLLSYYQEV